MAQKRDIHQEVTDKIVAAIERGLEGKWTMPWVSMASTGHPENAMTGKRYNGVNVLSLWCAAHDRQYPVNVWAGFRQWKERGASVRKGEKGEIVIFVKSLALKDENGDQRLDGNGKPAFFPMVKYSHVWNVAQVDGCEVETPDLPAIAERIDDCERFVSNTGATVRYGDKGAFYYHPPSDHIGMPAREAFRDTDHGTATERLYSTLFHELTHWTGATHRLDRERFRKGDGATKTADIESRAREELIAEIGAAFMCAEQRINAEPRTDHAQYIDTWLSVLKKDKRAIFTAAGKASEAVAYLNDLQGNADQIAA